MTAVAFTDPGVDTGVTTASTTYSSGSWTPGANELIIAFVYVRGSAMSPTSVVHAPGGSAISLTQIATVDRGTAGRLELWVGDAGASPPTGVTTATYASAGTGGHVSVFSAANADLSGGAAAAIVQSNTSVQANTATPSVSLPSGAGHADNRCIAAFGSAQTNALTERTNWTEQGETSFSGPSSNLETQYRTDAFEQDASGSGAGSTDDWSNIVAEVKASVGSTPITVSIAQTLPALTQDATVSNPVAADVGQTLPALTQDATVQVGAPVDAVIDQTLPALTQDVTVDVLVDVTIAQTLPALTQDAAVDVLVDATGAQTLPALTQDVTVDVLVDVTIDQTLPALTQDATVQVGTPVTVSIDQTLPALTQDATASVLVEIQVAQTLPALTQDASVNALVEAIGDSVLSALTQTASVDVLVEAIVGSVLPALTQDVTVDVAQGVEATLDQTLPALTQAADVAVAVEAAVASVLPALTQAVETLVPGGPISVTVTSILPSLTQRARMVFAGGGREGWVVWRETRNPNRNYRNVRRPNGDRFRGGP